MCVYVCVCVRLYVCVCVCVCFKAPSVEISNIVHLSISLPTQEKKLILQRNWLKACLFAGSIHILRNNRYNLLLLQVN